MLLPGETPQAEDGDDVKKVKKVEVVAKAVAMLKPGQIRGAQGVAVRVAL